jgi:hypothetical protein
MLSIKKIILPSLLLTLFSSLSQAALPPSLQHLQQAQIALFRAGTDLFMHRGEGRSAELAAQVEQDLQALSSHINALQQQALPPLAQQAFSNVPVLLTNFDQRVRQTLAYAPSEPDLPWEFNFEYSKAQRELWSALQDSSSALQQTQERPLSAADQLLLELPAKLQALATRYVARAYIGDIETLAEQQQLYIHQDIDQLAKSVNQDLQTLDQLRSDEASKKILALIHTRWNFIYARLLDYSNNMTPLMIERHSTEIIAQLLRLE